MDRQLMTSAMLNRRASAAVRAVETGVDGPLALSYVVWPSMNDPHFGLPVVPARGASKVAKRKIEKVVPPMPPAAHIGNWKESDIVGETDIYA